VKTIGDYAFYGCSSLTTVNIPKHLRKIVKNKNIFPKDTKIIVRE